MVYSLQIIIIYKNDFYEIPFISVIFNIYTTPLARKFEYEIINNISIFNGHHLASTTYLLHFKHFYALQSEIANYYSINIHNSYKNY